MKYHFRFWLIETREYDVSCALQYSIGECNKTPQTETLILNKGNILLAYADNIVIIEISRENIQSTV